MADNVTLTVAVKSTWINMK